VDVLGARNLTFGRIKKDSLKRLSKLHFNFIVIRQTAIAFRLRRTERTCDHTITQMIQVNEEVSRFIMRYKICPR